MKTAICPGSFDPVTLGHLDIIERAAGLFDQVTVLVMQNSAKQDGLFTVEERCRLIRRCLHAENIQIDTYDGLLVDYAKQTGAAAVVKGLRALSDFEYEFQQALTNKSLCPQLETVRPSPLPACGRGNSTTPPCVANMQHYILERGFLNQFRGSAEKRGTGYESRKIYRPRKGFPAVGADRCDPHEPSADFT